MDVHRSRFVPYPPSAINALAFSHPGGKTGHNPGPSTLRLAVGRGNGDIELWNPLRGAWVQEAVFRGGKDRSIEGLAWTQEPEEVGDDGKTRVGQLRLFSIGYSAAVTEWDLCTGLPVRHSSGTQSEIWCIAAQPKVKKGEVVKDGEFRGQNLIVGCADGTLALLSTADGELRFQKYMSRTSGKKARVLSVTWKDRNTVVAGYADSTIRVYDVRNGTLIRSMSLGAGPSGAPKEKLVWTVKCLPNGHVVSGDSSGEVRIWDGKLYTQIQRMQGHEADVMDLVTSEDGRTIFSGGTDRRTCIYRLQMREGQGKRSTWSKVSHRRYHDHDVKAMATCETKTMSVVVSGGVDTTPIVIPLREHGQEKHRTLSGLPQSSPVISAPGQRLVVSWWGQEVNIWRIGKRQVKDGHSERPRKLMARLAVKGEESITSASISHDGSRLAVATVAQIKLFSLQTLETRVRVRKIEIPESIAILGARMVQFSANGKWLSVISTSNRVYVARLKNGDPTAAAQSTFEVIDKVIELRRIHRKLNYENGLNGSWGTYDRTITRISFSDDGRVLVVSDIHGYMDVWVLEGHEDTTAPEVDVSTKDSLSLSSDDDDESSDDENEDGVIVFHGQHWTRSPTAALLPKLDSTPLILSFAPFSPSQAASHAKESLVNGNPAVHPTRHNPHPHAHTLPTGPYNLMVLTAEHRLYEFDVLEGRLSDWSKRNPSTRLPLEFQRALDRGIGAVWDVTDRVRRLWLYSASWIFMFDLNQDLPASPFATGANSLKSVEAPADGEASKDARRETKREMERNRRKRKYMEEKASSIFQGSGAGGRIEGREMEGVTSKVRKTEGPDASKGAFVKLDPLPPSANDENDTDMPDASDLEEDDDEDRLALIGTGPLATMDTDEDGDDAVTAATPGKKQGKRAPRSWWHTYNYRAILGMVPLGRGEQNDMLEVVVVERPAFDLDLPPRFVGVHERDRE